MSAKLCLDRGRILVLVARDGQCRFEGVVEVRGTVLSCVRMREFLHRPDNAGDAVDAAQGALNAFGISALRNSRSAAAAAACAGARAALATGSPSRACVASW